MDTIGHKENAIKQNKNINLQQSITFKKKIKHQFNSLSFMKSKEFLLP